MNDEEPLAAAANIAAAERLKSAFEKDKTLPKPVRYAPKNAIFLFPG